MDIDRARIQQAVLDWVREDCGAAVKMSLQRHHIDRLVERLCNSKPAPVASSPPKRKTPPAKGGSP